MLARLKGPGIFLLIAFAGTYLFVHLYLNSRVGYGWLTGEGKIKEVTEQRIGNDYWAGLIKYDYSFNDEVYSGSGVPLDDFDDPIIWPQHRYEIEKMAAWREKEFIPILINPEDPSESTTFPDYHGGFLVAAIIFGLMLALAIVVFITAIGGKRQNRMLSENQARQFMDAARKKYME